MHKEEKMTYTELESLFKTRDEWNGRLYICNFLNCDQNKMKEAKVTVVKNVLGKYVVTEWLDYEYGRYRSVKEFSDKDAAADHAWELLGGNGTGFHKVVHFIDKKHFGDTVIVYRGSVRQSTVYFTVVKDREETVYYLIDSKLEKMYPMLSYVNALGIHIAPNDIPEYLDVTFDIDLSRYGWSQCPPFFAQLIRNSI